MFTFVGHSREVSDVCFSPDNKFAVTGSSDKSIRVWAVTRALTFEKMGIDPLVHTFKGHAQWVSAVSCCQNHGQETHLVSGAADGEIIVWSLQSGKLLKRVEAHTDRIVALRCTKELIVSASEDGTARIWDLDTVEEVAELEGHTRGLTGLDLASDGKTAVTCGFDATVRIWDLQDAMLIRKVA